MGRVAPQQRIASAHVVLQGRYGDVRCYAQQRGVYRQWVYREAAWVQEVLTHSPAQCERLRTHVRQLQQRPLSSLRSPLSWEDIHWFLVFHLASST